jgi:hypothetical protein
VEFHLIFEILNKIPTEWTSASLPAYPKDDAEKEFYNRLSKMDLECSKNGIIGAHKFNNDQFWVIML